MPWRRGDSDDCWLCALNLDHARGSGVAPLRRVGGQNTGAIVVRIRTRCASTAIDCYGQCSRCQSYCVGPPCDCVVTQVPSCEHHEIRSVHGECISNSRHASSGQAQDPHPCPDAEQLERANVRSVRIKFVPSMRPQPRSIRGELAVARVAALCATNRRPNGRQMPRPPTRPCIYGRSRRAWAAAHRRPTARPTAAPSAASIAASARSRS